MRIVLATTAAVSCLALGGCGIGAKVEARNDYQASEAQYKACLVENSATPQKCEGLRLAMEADERKYNNFSSGITAGGHSSSTTTVLNR
jgi:hypothetical protein